MTDELKARVAERIKALEYEGWLDSTIELIKDLTAREEKLVETLKFYSNSEHYLFRYGRNNTAMERDQGMVARATLSELGIGE